VVTLDRVRLAGGGWGTPNTKRGSVDGESANGGSEEIFWGDRKPPQRGG
jgi:hypothetical protein